MKVRQKRYQFRAFGGVEWTPWFNYNGPEDPIQLKGYKGDHLKNEFRTIEVE